MNSVLPYSRFRKKIEAIWSILYFNFFWCILKYFEVYCSTREISNLKQAVLFPYSQKFFEVFWSILFNTVGTMVAGRVLCHGSHCFTRKSSHNESQSTFISCHQKQAICQGSCSPSSLKHIHLQQHKKFSGFPLPWIICKPVGRKLAWSRKCLKFNTLCGIKLNSPICWHDINMYIQCNFGL